MKKVLTIEVSRTGASPWVLAEIDDDRETVSEERGCFTEGRENTRENGDPYTMEEMAMEADEVWECDSLASRRNSRQIK